MVGFLFLLLLFLEELYGEVSLSQFSLKPFLVRRSTFQKNYPNIFKSNLQNFTGDVKLHLRKTKFPEVPFSRPSHDIWHIMWTMYHPIKDSHFCKKHKRSNCGGKLQISYKKQRGSIGQTLLGEKDIISRVYLYLYP